MRHIYSIVNMIQEHYFGHLRGKLLFNKFGENSYILKPLRIINGKYVNIGKNVSVLKYIRLEAWNMGKYSKPHIFIGDNTNIEQNVHITCGESIIIGEGCSLLGGSVITDIIHPYENPMMKPSDQSINTKPVNIGKHCQIGMYAMIMPGVSLGEHVIVGGNSVVTRSFPSFSVIAGVPAKIIKQYNFDNMQWESSI